MNTRKLMLATILLLAVLTIGCVSASDENITSDELTVPEDILVESAADETMLTTGDDTELSELITNASVGSTINLEKDYEYTNPSADGITIDKQLTIDGKGHTIDAKSSSRIFTLTSRVTLKNLILKNGQYGDGGAINAYDQVLNCENCTFINCTSSFYGGAIYAEDGTINNSTFINCTSSVYGGAIRWQYTNYGEVINSRFINCTAEYGGATSLGAYYMNNTFTNCAATVSGGASYWYAYKSDSSWRKDNYLEKSTFINCSAQNGGAIYLREYEYTFSGNSFENCHAVKGGILYSDVLATFAENNITNCYADKGSIYYMQKGYDENNYISSDITSFEYNIPSPIWVKGKYNATFKLDEKSNGTVVLTIGGMSRNASVINGNATIELFNYNHLSFDDTITYKVEYIEDGLVKYESSSKFLVRTEGPSDYVFNVTCPNELFIGDNYLMANGSVSNHIQGTVRIYFDSAFPYYNSWDIDKKYYVDPDRLTVGKYSNVVFKFIPEDKYFESKTYNTTLSVYPFKITMPETVIIGTYNGAYTSDSEMKINWYKYIDDDDTFKVLIDGEEYYSSQYADSSVDLSNLSLGNHTYEFKYLGSTYKPVSKTASFNTTYAALAYSTTVQFDEEAQITVCLPQGATGDAIIKIGDKEYSVKVNDSKAIVKMSNLPVGDYSIGINYAGDSNFPEIILENIAELHVIYKINFNKPKYFGQSMIVNLTLPSNASGNLTVKYNGNTMRQKMADGKAQITLSNLTLGYNSVTFKYEGDDYNVDSDWTSFDISLNAPSSIERNVTDLGYLEISDLPLDMKGTILAYRNSVSTSNLIANVTPVNGKALIPLDNLKLANQRIYLKYSEYDSYSQQVNAKVNPILTFTGGSVISGNTTLLKVELPKDATGKVVLTYDDGYSVMAGWADAGEITINCPFVKGQVYVTAPDNFTAEQLYFNFYIEDSKYGFWQSTYMDRVIYIFNVTDDPSQVIDTIIIDNLIDVETNSTPANNDSSNKTDVETNSTPANNDSSNKTDDVPLKVDVKVTAGNVKTVYTSNLYYTIAVYGSDGKPAKDESVVVKLNGKTFTTLKTGANGVAKFKITQVPGTYKVQISALGKSLTKTLTVKHIVTLKSAAVKKSAKKLVLTATLSKVNKKYLKNKKITFKFNGKKYTAKTNSKGVAKVTIKSNVLNKLKVGKKVTYQATYLKDTVKKTVKVKK